LPASASIHGKVRRVALVLARRSHIEPRMKKPILFAVLAAFLGLNAYALYSDGLIDGFITLFKSINGWGFVLVADLLIALSLIGGWMIKDARKEGRSAAPYLLLTLASGSVGPLVYLLRKR
jgi:hypothetical protein